MVKNGTRASPAIARASSVLPVPGEPTSSAPLGIWPPSLEKRCGSFRNSTISSSSSRASSMPATSSNVTRPCFSVSSLAFDLPKPIAPEPPPFCTWRSAKNATPRISRNGSDWIRSTSSRLGCSRLGAGVLHAASVEQLGQLGVVGDGHGGEGGAVLELAGDPVGRDLDFLDAAFGDLGAEIGIAQLRAGRLARAAEHRDHQQQGEEDPAPHQQALHPGVAVAFGFAIFAHQPSLSVAANVGLAPVNGKLMGGNWPTPRPPLSSRTCSGIPLGCACLKDTSDLTVPSSHSSHVRPCL